MIIDGIGLTRSSDDGYTFEVKQSDGTPLRDMFGNKAVDNDGLNGHDWYLIDIPIYNSETQAKGARPNDRVILEVFKDGTRLMVIKPDKGKFRVGGSGSITQVNLQASRPVE